MGKHAKAWARRKRDELLEELGPICVHCKERRREKLTFDHIEGKDWSARGKSTDQRMCRYLKEHRLYKNIQVLCNKCNAIKGDPIPIEIDERICIDQPEDYVMLAVTTEDCPF